MNRGLWSGAISFGLLNVPVVLMSSKEKQRLSFHMLDKRDFAPIGYKQINKATGKEVTRKNIVKGYEYEKSKFVVVEKSDFVAANPKATQTVDIEDFVDLDDLDVLLFEKPYYLVPGKNGEKGYVLLHKVLQESKKVAIATFVLRNRQHLSALMAKGPYLILETLRFAHEVLGVKDADFLDTAKLARVKVSPREVKMAQALVAEMTSKWQPEKYKDTYQNDLQKLIQRKIKSGKTQEVAEIDAPEATDTNVVDLMPLLQKSLKANLRGRSRSKRKSSARAHA